MSNILPALLSSLLGRERETATLHKLLTRADVRLVTITGPGGVGKTSLALHVVHEIRDAFEDGVFFISLAPINDSTLIIPTIAQALGVTESPNRLLLDSLKDFLRKKQMLLLLDNFEQIVSAAPLLTELLNACAELRMLVTSREALRLRGEHEFPLAPLELDDHAIRSDDRSGNTLMQSPAIALFIQRVQAVQPDFHLTEENAPAVTEICARLDGLPLAIELAAARIKLLPPRAMLEKLQESSLQLLTSGARDMPARQQTLRSAIQWSYELLEDEEKYTFRWLAAFIGGCTLEAARIVIGPSASLDVLESLVGKSLVRQTEIDRAPRLTMLETMREFGLEQLNHTHELESARRAHATYYLIFAEDAERELTGADQKSWLQRLEREQDNLRAALQWAIDYREGDFAQRMAGALQPFWFRRGRWSEGRRWLEDSLAMESSSTLNQSIRANVLYGAGMLARFQGDFARARILCEQCLALYRALADQTGVLKTLVQLGRIVAFQDDQPVLKTTMEEAASLIESLPDTVTKADAYIDMTIAQVRADSYPPQVPRYLAESERIQRAFHNTAGLAFVFIHQGNHASWNREYALAVSCFDEAQRLAIELDDDRLLGRIFMSRALLDIQEGNSAATFQHLDDFIRQAINRGDHQVRTSLPMLALILYKRGHHAWSARVLGLAEALNGRSQLNADAAAIAQRLRIGDIRAELRTLLGDEAFTREFAAGQQLTLDALRAMLHSQTLAPAPATPLSTAGVALTVREIEVLRLLAQDLSNPQIAEKLVVSRRTVDAHLRSIYDKLSVKSRDAAIRVARERGIISSL
jgi:predicted ATPase/DNA-binding CsgD family transcriptional regulator